MLRKVVWHVAAPLARHPHMTDTKRDNKTSGILALSSIGAAVGAGLGALVAGASSSFSGAPVGALSDAIAGVITGKLIEW